MEKNITNVCDYFDVIHFEALSGEDVKLDNAMREAISSGLIPADYKFHITGETVQVFLEKNPDYVLPNIISTKTHSQLPEDWINSGVKKSVITRSAGYDHFEHLREVVNVASLREYCVQAVAQTALGFVYAMGLNLNELTNMADRFDRNNAKPYMEFGPNRVATVFGASGKIGGRIYELLQVNGFSVQGVDIREINSSVNYVSKGAALRNSDIIINAMNYTKDEKSPLYNKKYFSDEDFANVKNGLLFANVTRGDIAPESGVLKALDSGRLGGVALDVFTNESEFDSLRKSNGEFKTNHPDLVAAKILVDRSIARDGNIYVSPHQGFNSDVASKNKADEAIKHLVSWLQNSGQRFNEQLPYY